MEPVQMESLHSKEIGSIRCFYTGRRPEVPVHSCKHLLQHSAAICRSRNNHLTARNAIKQMKQLRVHVKRRYDVPSSLRARCDIARSGGCRSPVRSTRKGFSGMTCGETCESLVPPQKKEKKSGSFLLSLPSHTSPSILSPAHPPPQHTHTPSNRWHRDGVGQTNYLPNYDLSLKSIISPRNC